MISWSPDGKWIAFSDLLPEEEHAKIYLLSTKTWETKRIPSAPRCPEEAMPAFSHNGEYLAYWCFPSMNETALYSLSLTGGQLKLISLFQNFPQGPTWSADDKELIYSLGNGSGTVRELDEVSVASGSVQRLALAGSADFPTVSPKGDKLAFSLFSNNVNIWRRDLLDPEAPAVELFPSTRGQANAQYSPDGRRIVFASDRSGVLGVWVSDDDGTNLVQISNPHDQSGSPQWSPDGKM
jgi:Tol biopolymer transport system component